MIRILYMSDVHLEMERWRLEVPGWGAFRARHKAAARHPARGPLLEGFAPVDLIVLAGDIHNGLRGIIYAEQLASYLAAPVVVVAGNHEFYHHDVAVLLPALHATTAKTQGQVSFLDNNIASFDIRGQRLNVLGCTLWTDYELNGTQSISMQTAQSRMNDHAFIKFGKAAFRPADALAMHQKSRLWLHKTLASLHKQDPAAQNLIVTHHAPSGLVLGERTGGIAPAYGSDMLVEFAPWQPAAWIHGHTHHRHDSVIEGIRVLSAPRGYVSFDGGAALEFVPGVVEI